jgi:hypothetical protein
MIPHIRQAKLPVKIMAAPNSPKARLTQDPIADQGSSGKRQDDKTEYLPTTGPARLGSLFELFVYR